MVEVSACHQPSSKIIPVSALLRSSKGYQDPACPTRSPSQYGGSAVASAEPARDQAKPSESRGLGAPGGQAAAERAQGDSCDDLRKLTEAEFPAGLIDKGETPEQAALRELYEETGYKEGVSVRRSSPVVVKDPG